MINLANFYNALVNSAAYIERIFEFLHEPVVIDDKTGRATNCPGSRAMSVFDQVSFAYDPGHPVLEKVSFDGQTGRFPGAGRSDRRRQIDDHQLALPVL